MTYGHLFLIVIGLVFFAIFLRLVNPPSEFRREYHRPRGTQTHDEMPKLSQANSQAQMVDKQPTTVDLRIVNSLGAKELQEDRLAQVSQKIAAQIAASDHAQAYLQQLRDEYKKYEWHSERGHALRTLIVETSAAIDARRRNLG